MDLPSGVHADTGEVLGTAIRAEATVCFGILKRGNLLYPGHVLGGRLHLSRISFPPELFEDDAIPMEINTPLTPRPRDPAGHKGSFGKVLLVGGSDSYRGAPVLAAAAVLRTGAGSVRLACPAPLVSDVLPLIPEAVFLPQRNGKNHLGGDVSELLIEHAGTSDASVLGPGLSTHPESLELARSLISSIPGPLLVDADALTSLAGMPELTKNRDLPAVLTPHPGEMARLMDITTGDIAADRVGIAGEAAGRYGAVVVLKGAHTLIAEPSGRIWMNLTGNDGMGGAGSGDVLAGVIGALMAGSLGPLEAARLGVLLHGLAGDRARDRLGRDGLMARDILEELPGVLIELRSEGPTDPFFGKIHVL